MATQFDQSRVTVQPQAAEQPHDLSSVFDRQASFLSGIANQEFANTTAAIGQASASFDRAIDAYGKEAAQRAVDQAPALIKRDGNGDIIPPSSFYPAGFSTRAYSETFKATAEATYKVSAEQELANYSDQMKAKFAGDPSAYAAAMATKRGAMRTNLDPTMAPWIDMRAEQIQAQGISQLNVARQVAQNAYGREQADRAVAGVREDARRLASSTDVARGGGGSQAGFDNNTGNITNSASQYSGGKGLPLLHPNGLKFETFRSAEQGVAAQYDLVKYRVDEASKVGKYLSFAELVDKWDPAATPETKANYATAIAKAAGLQPGDTVPIGDDAKMAAVLKAQNIFEKGKQTVPDSAFTDGIRYFKKEPGVTPGTQLVSDAVATVDPAALEKRATLALNSAELKQRLEQAETIGRANGKQPAEIQKDRDELVYEVQIGAMSEQIKNSASSLYGRDNNIDQGAVAAAVDTIRKIAAKYPSREKQVTDSLMQALDYAQQQAARQANQLQVDDQRRTEPVIRQRMAMAADARAAADAGDTITANSIRQNLERASRADLNNTQLSDSAAMKLAVAGFQSGAVSKAAMEEGNTNRINGFNLVMKDTTASPEQKASAFASAQAIRNDPEIYSQLNASQRAFLQGGTDDYIKANYGGQLGAFHKSGLAGDIPPPKIDEIRAEQWKKNMLDPNQAPQIALLDEQMKTAWKNKDNQSRLAAQFLDNHGKGLESTPDQLAAFKKENAGALAPPGNAPAWDLKDDAHAAKAQEIYRKYGLMPDSLQASLNAITLSPDETVMKGPKALLETIRQVERDKMEKVMGKQYDENKENLLAGKVAAIVGSKYTYLANATLYDAATANKFAIAFGPEPSKAGSSGQTADQARQSVGASVDGLPAMLLSAGNLSMTGELLSDPQALMASEQTMTPQQKAIVALGGLVPSGGLTGAIAALGGKSQFDKIEMDPNYRDHLVNNGMIHLANDGKAIAAHETGKNGPETFVASTALFTSLRSGEAGVTVSADGKTATIGFKTLGQLVGPVLGVPMTKPMEQNFAANMLVAERNRTGQSLTGIDPEYVTSRSYKAANGEDRIRIVQQDRNGNITQAEDMAKSDPRLSLQALAVVRAATQSVIAKSEGAITPEQYGSAAFYVGTGGPIGQVLVQGANIATGGTDAPVGIPGVSGPTIKLKYPVEGYVNLGSLIGHTIQDLQVAINRPEAIRLMLSNDKMRSDIDDQARKAMQGDFNQRLMALNAEVTEYKKKFPNAPGLKETLTHMMENHAPGLDSTMMQEMIKNSGFYQPGELPHVVTGPTRINKNEPR